MLPDLQDHQRLMYVLPPEQQEGIIAMKKPSFFRKYFLQGQHLDESAVIEVPKNADFLQRFFITKRKWIAFVTPIIITQICWWMAAIKHDWLSLYATHWAMPAIMILGSPIAGMTSEGGGAVAFPFMTLGLQIDPVTARDFSLLLQSLGMSCAMFVVIFMGVQLESRAVLFGTIGSIPGMVVGFNLVDPLLTPPQKKMLFVSIWTSFAIALFILNYQVYEFRSKTKVILGKKAVFNFITSKNSRATEFLKCGKKRTTYPKIPHFCAWKAIVLAFTGFVGGIFTAFAGSGVDICTFSVITLLFRVTEKTATPTTVVLMGINSIVGSYYRVVWDGDVTQLTYDYFKVTIPVAVTLAPFGSFLGSHFHRQVLASFLYILETLAVIGFLITKPAVSLILTGLCIIVCGFFFFQAVSRYGERLMEQIENEKNADIPMEVATTPEKK